jgi:hypothetical protein
MMRYFLLLTGYLLLVLPGRAQRDCRSFEYRQEALKNDPGLAARISAIEQFTRRLQPSAGQRPSVIVTGTDPAGQDPRKAALSLITIPVVVHIVYNSSAQNISDAQVQSQIDVLNADYHKQNADTARIPGYFSPLAADCGFRFALATLDTNGNATTGIVRRHTAASSFSVNDNIKFMALGGDDAWDRERYLNIWVGNLTGGILGYSSMPGGRKETDGVVILYTAFGTRGTATAPFNLGRTATHEIGHWLNLIHTWGDAPCGDDEVGDTPPQQTSTQGNPSGMIVSCSNGPYGNMYMDYMDFTDDIGMHMFTYGQRDRMRTLFAEGGFRYALLSSNGSAGSPVTTGAVTGTTLQTAGELSLQFYPNPSVGAISVKMNDPARIGSVLDVYNQVGQKVLELRVTELSFQLNISSLPGGIYFARLRDSHQSGSYKLVKL